MADAVPTPAPRRRMFLVLLAGCGVEKETVLALLVQAGLAVEDVEIIALDDLLQRDDIDDAVVLVPVDAAVCDAPELDQLGRQCGSAGADFVILLAPEFHFPRLHPVTEKWGTQCGWSVRDLAACLPQGGTAPPRSSSGTRLRQSQHRSTRC